MTELSTRERIYNFIVSFKRKHDGVAPTFREICDEVHIVKSTADFHMKKLEDEGRVTRLPGGRGIMVAGGKWTSSTERYFCGMTEPVVFTANEYVISS